VTVPVLEQDVQELDLSFRAGNDYSFQLTCSLDLTTYTIEAKIGKENFAISIVDPYTRVLSLTDLQTIGLKNFTPWHFTLTKNGISRTFFSGKYIKL
jgi:hypothetical protein